MCHERDDVAVPRAETQTPNAVFRDDARAGEDLIAFDAEDAPAARHESSELLFDFFVVNTWWTCFLRRRRRARLRLETASRARRRRGIVRAVENTWSRRTSDHRRRRRASCVCACTRRINDDGDDNTRSARARKKTSLFVLRRR